MLIEAFSVGKNPAAPEANEDRFVVLPGRAYAVIDGVTDRTGTFYDGKSSGRIAAEVLQSALERLVPADHEPLVLLEHLSEAIQAAYRRYDLLDRARDEPNLRFGATLALFRHRGDADEVLLVGDSGIRLNGIRVLQVDKPLDSITASLRVAAWETLSAKTSDVAVLTRVGRQIVFHGAGQGTEHLEGLIDAAELAAIADTAVARSQAQFPHLPVDAIAALVQGGIVHGQFRHQNSATSPLGYSSLDGFAVPRSHVTIERFPAGSVQTVELFSDGYFAPPPGFGVAAWEAAADEVERVDPLKIGPYASVKGSMGEVRTDDRTYVGVKEAVLF
jgi:hypothetical protein